MIALVASVLLWAGPPALPDLPAERAAKARVAQEEARQEEARQEEARAARREEPRAREARPADPSASSTDAPTQSVPISARQLRGAAPSDGPSGLESASSAEVDAWVEDDAAFGAPAKPDAALSRPDAPPPEHPPTRTAARMRRAEPLEQPGGPPRPKRSAAFVFGYRIFTARDAFARSQSWHVGSLEVTPVRRWVRFNLVTEVGAEGGEAARGGDRADVFMMQKAGLGAQIPGWFTPFIEFQGGAGMARIEVFDQSEVLLLWTLGLDAGAQWAVTRWMRIHAAVGWIRPTFERPERAVYHDSFTFKLGIGF